MTDDEVASFLNEQRVINIATLGPTGHPHLVALWFGVQDNNPVFWTFGKSQKIVNLRRDARITGLVETGKSYDQLRGVEVVGSAKLVEDPEELAALGLCVATKYSGPPTEQTHAYVRSQIGKRVGVVLQVEKVVSWDHSKLGGTR